MGLPSAKGTPSSNISTKSLIPSYYWLTNVNFLVLVSLKISLPQYWIGKEDPDAYFEPRGYSSKGEGCGWFP